MTFTRHPQYHQPPRRSPVRLFTPTPDSYERFLREMVGLLEGATPERPTRAPTDRRPSDASDDRRERVSQTDIRNRGWQRRRKGRHR
jgi:hypothetical protein